MQYDVFRRLFRVYVANLLLLDEYAPPRFEGRLTLYEAKYQRTSGSAAEPWRAVAGDVDAIELPGNHLTIMREPYVRVLAATIAEALVRTAGRAAELQNI